MSTQASGRAVEILLVEDNPGDARLTIETLKEGKVRYHLSVARDGVEALAPLAGRASTRPRRIRTSSEPRRAIRARHLRRHQCGKVGGVAALRLGQLAGRLELLQGVLADGLEHPEAGFLILAGRVPHSQEALVGEQCQVLQRRQLGQLRQLRQLRQLGQVVQVVPQPLGRAAAGVRFRHRKADGRGRRDGPAETY